MVDKDTLLKHLENDIYCRIGVSKINGVGVIAIKDIPKETDPFKHLSPLKDKIIKLKKDDIKHLNQNVKQIIGDFFGSESKDRYDVLYYGPNYINISFYLNHSNNPNLKIVSDDPTHTEYLKFKTNTTIKEGEELTINYSDYNKF